MIGVQIKNGFIDFAKTEYLNNGKKFCKSFDEYMKSDRDVQQFYEDGTWSYDTIKKELVVGSGWNTRQRILLTN